MSIEAQNMHYNQAERTPLQSSILGWASGHDDDVAIMITGMELDASATC